MLSCRGSSVLSLLVILTTASGAVSCGNKASDSRDAASDAALDAAATNDASSADTGGGSIASDAGAATAVAPQVVPLLPRPTPFSGTYRCFKGGMQLEQAGNIVLATMHKDSTTDTVVACTAVGDLCTGTVRDIQGGRGKVKKVVNVRPVTLQRTAGGDILFNLSPSPSAKSTGSKTSSSSKSAAGDQTFCLRR